MKMRTSWLPIALPACLPLVLAFVVLARAEAAEGDLAQVYVAQVHPLMVKTCGGCHGAEPKDNDLDLAGFATSEALLGRPAVLEHVIERLHVGDMPPREAPQPSDAEREQLLGWFTAALDAEAAARAGDPGPVTLRRLSNVAYDNAVRDLTGVDMRPTQAREFPPDAVGGEGFANVGEAMPVTPVLVERYLQAARDVAARAVLLPTGFRFSASPDRPEWTAEAEKALRAFHSRYSGPAGEPPLERHLAATLRHREKLASGGPAALAAVAAEENLSLPYLTALWTGLSGTAASPTEDVPRAVQWLDKVAEIEAEKQRRQATLQAGRQKIDADWANAKRVLVESTVDEGGSVPFEQKVSVRRGELLILSVLPGKSHGADSTLVEWTIRETAGEQRTWSVADLVPDLLKGNPWQDKQDARWSFLETTKGPAYLTDKRDINAGKSEVKSWSLGSEPSVFVNSAAEPVQVWTKLPARSFFVHPGNNRPVAVAWTSPIDAEVVIAGRVADAHPGDPDGVSFELAHVAEPEMGQALVVLGSNPAAVPSAGPPPATIGLVREKWRTATTDPKPVMQAIKALQDRLFWDAYDKFKVLAVGNGFPAWQKTLRVVASERAEGSAREPLFRLVALQIAPAEPAAHVIWDRLRLEGGDGPTVVLAEHPELRAAVEACGLRFGHHPQGRAVPPTALVTEAPSETIIDLRKLPDPLLKMLALPRFLRADVSLDEGSPESATVQPLVLGQPDDFKAPGGWIDRVAAWRSGDKLVLAEPEPRVAQLTHPRVAAERARPAAEFRDLFPPAVLFAPLVPRDAQASIFMFRREDEPLRRLALDDAGRAELERLWSELHFVSEDAFLNERMYDEMVAYYRSANEYPVMSFHIQTIGDSVRGEKADLLAAQVAAEPAHLEQLVAFAARAWRRPLTTEEREAILAGYKADRADGMSHDPAFRVALARALSSPWFLYRVEEPTRGPSWQPVTGLELATRLSFLVWDSIPDDDLMVAAPRLHEPAVMEAQLRRMLKDVRARGMAEEFGARWLGVRDFVANHGRSGKDFPEFTPALRDSLAEEPVRFFEDLLLNDRPVLDLISADAVVVNDVLAKHYGIPGVTGPEWRRVEKVAAHGRGGLLGFGAVLAKQSAAARTSPIKRGAWVVQMLGERLPNPPADVPPLPETPPAGLSVREITEFHTQDARCSGCHSRIDPFGMTLGQFDALGRLRPAAELKPGETRATLRDGTVIDDVAGLRNYIAGPRRDDLVRSLARKLTGYALGRAVLPSDRPLVDTLTKTMAGGGRWSDALLVIVQSEQFRCTRPVATVAVASP
jgi:mono/diheme cytochrome c family protein